MKKYALIILSLAVLFGCQKEKDSLKVFDSKEILGLASPVSLLPGKTEIYLQDYFINPEKIDSIILPAGLTLISDENSILFLAGDISKPLDLLQFRFGDTTLSIPLKSNRKVEYTFSFPLDEKYQSVELKGNFNGWNSKASPMTYENGKYTYTTNLFPAEYQYLLVLDGKEMLDPFNSDSVDNGSGGFNSRLQIGDPKSKTPFIYAEKLIENGFTVKSDQKLDSCFVLWENSLLPRKLVTLTPEGIQITIPEIATKKERSHIRIWAYNEKGLSNDMLIPLEFGKVITDANKLKRTDKHAFRMYFLMVDRFFNAISENDKPVNDPEIKPQANYMGGDIAGVTEKIKSGYFNELNVNTVWLSPIGLNPQGAWGLYDKGGVKSKFSGYHGYWPAESKKVDPRMGTEEDLKNLIATAHEQKDNILLDYVANHVHLDHPVYKQHPEWATALYLPDGTMNTEKWDEYRLTTWFDTHLPTLNLENPEVTQAMSDSALFWFKNYEIDGFRHDATKHVPEIFWRTLTRKLKTQVMIPEGRSVYQIGETYGNAELIGSYVSTGQMDGQFDFNVYDKSISILADENKRMMDLMTALNESLTFYGYHNLMGYISGNQDRPRFISLADGSVKFEEDSKLAGWTRSIENNGKIGYKRLAQLHAFNFTIPGIPVIYYGDEIGLPGANDPDNRRMMIFDSLNENQIKLKETVSKLAELRKNNMALIYGDLRVIDTDEFTLVIERRYFDQRAILIMNNVSKIKNFAIPNSDKLNPVFGSKKSEGAGHAIVSVEPHGFEILTN